MLAPSANLLRAGLVRASLALKLEQVKRATRSYLRDRTHQATDSATSYILAAANRPGSRRCFAGSRSITACFRRSAPSAHCSW